MDYNKAPIEHSPFDWQRTVHQDMKVKDWIVPQWQSEKKDWNVVLLGSPLSRSSISVSGASEFPNAFRQSWEKFSTYYIDEDIDIRELTVADIGNVKMHVTDILRCHQHIEDAMESVAETYPNALKVTIGGDHSVTAATIRGLKKVMPEKKIGILQLDTHLDLRSTDDHGPTNGTPIRQLIEGRVIEGKHVYNIGLHGFYNAPSLIEAANDYEVHRIRLKELRQKGIEQTIQDILSVLMEQVDFIYVTVDMDVLDISYAPGVPASTPGGMRSDELLEILYEVGKCDGIGAIDFVCIDPTKDNSVQATVKTTTYAFLTFLASFYQHRVKKFEVL